MKHFTQGTIEGFFGQEWSWLDRFEHIRFLSEIGMDCYVYAPKSDRTLRTKWREDWSQDTFEELLKLRLHCRTLGIQFGIGLSPIDFHTKPETESLLDYQSKLEKILQLDPEILCLCFDDMKADIPGLAQVQINLVEYAQKNFNFPQIILCPSYYTDDPILEEVFGKRPEDYWDTLKIGLSKEVGLFWTGPKVCSKSYSGEHLEGVKKKLGDRIWLWDNYPVNDGRKLVDFLHIAPPQGRGVELQSHCRGQLINPMNQAFLSRIPMVSMSHKIEESLNSLPDCLQYLEGTLDSIEIEILTEWGSFFQSHGMQGLKQDQRKEILSKLRGLDTPLAKELSAWLQGDYAFDPKCLT